MHWIEVSAQSRSLTQSSECFDFGLMSADTPGRYPYFDVVEGLAWSYEPESYAGVSVYYWYGLPCQTGQEC